MPLNLVDYEIKSREAVQAFWGNRDKARQKQRELGIPDAGERGAVTAGKNMDGFTALFIDLARANGLDNVDVYQRRSLLTLPGYFRPTKIWDMLIVNKGRLVAALELKSHVGSFGNNFNNRAEEAIGTACDLWTAYREGAFGEQPRPFVGWLMLVEDAPKILKPVRNISPHFPVLPEFQAASYQQRYNLFCRRLVQEQLYTTACVIISPRTAIADGQYHELGDMTSLTTFVTSFAGHIAAEGAR